MAGAGNDFVIIDHRDGRLRNVEELTRRICTRRLSVGADGLILVEPSTRADFKIRYFNADGSLGEFCGNGTRCAARFAFLNEIAPAEMTIETDSGIVTAQIHDDNAMISVPIPADFRRERSLRLADGSTLQGSSIVVGVPHFMTFVPEGLWSMDVVRPGRQVRHHRELQPEGANANFVTVVNRHAIEVRTYERGVEDETLACGSGVVSAAVVSALFGNVDPPVAVRTRSGATLTVDFEQRGDKIEEPRLTGDARLIYESSITPETLEGFDPSWIRRLETETETEAEERRRF